MSKELFVSSTPHETKVAIVEEDQLAEIYYERENEYTLAGSIYKGRVTRVLPGMQSAFVNIGLERDAFLYVSDFLLEEEEDTEGLDQAILRSRPVITEPQETEAQSTPLEAEEIIPPAETSDEQHLERGGGPADQENARAEGDQDREGARKWRGRRRRRGRGGKFPERDEREQREPSPEPVREIHNVREAQPEPAAPNDLERMVLPGESISKYQPHDHAEAAHTPAPRVSSSRPSTEYSLDASAFSPGSMILPGESIAKYRPSHGSGSSAVATEQREQHEPSQHRFDVPVQESQSSDHAVEGKPHSEIQTESIQSHSNDVPDVAAASPENAFSENDDPGEPAGAHHGDAGDDQRYEHMNVASTFGGGAVEAPQETETPTRETAPTSSERSAVADADQTSTPYERSSWHTAGRGVMEEEEIDEEESDLPGYEEHLDGTDYEELEEEVLAGNELTEAVRDAHINERATGQYEAEGLGGREGSDEGDEDERDDADLAEEEEFESEEIGDQQEEPEGARAEHRAAAGTAGYQQQRTERRPSHDRRGGGRKPARRMRGGRRNFTPRQLPAISDLLKEGQEILVQIAKEPIAKKGARITSHIALPGRFLVYMPTVHHTGVSRKIASEEDRHRLKRIVLSERGEAQGGFIVRTAAAGANEEDLRADIRFLINLWNEIRGRADTAKAPALIYHDLNLVERILRDQVTNSFSQIWADTEQEYERILRFVSRFQPSLVKRVKLYSKETPLFEQFNITEEINKALKSKVWLKSGGYIVINQTEALVAIDINTGKYVGKTARLEDTIVKTNIDAIKEIVRQIRLRDLGGIIVIDFIDMDERKNRQKVMQALEEALKSDRAPSKVLQFNDFGLVAITRKRVKQSLERTLGQPCPTCQATGMIKSVTTVCNEIYVEMRKMARHFERDVMLRANPEVAKALKSNGGKWLQEMEDLTKRTILVKSDPLLHPEQFDIQ